MYGMHTLIPELKCALYTRGIVCAPSLFLWVGKICENLAYKLILPYKQTNCFLGLLYDLKYSFCSVQLYCVKSSHFCIRNISSLRSSLSACTAKLTYRWDIYMYIQKNNLQKRISKTIFIKISTKLIFFVEKSL